MDTAIVNSILLFEQLNPDTKMSHLDFHTAITRQLVRLFSECRFAPQPILCAPANTPTATTAAELLPATAPVPVPVVTTAARSKCTYQSASTERPFKMHQRSLALWDVCQIQSHLLDGTVHM